jgi:hypothetical protein
MNKITAAALALVTGIVAGKTLIRYLESVDVQGVWLYSVSAICAFGLTSMVYDLLPKKSADR